MSESITELDLVVLPEELPAKGLPRGKVGILVINP